MRDYCLIFRDPEYQEDNGGQFLVVQVCWISDGLNS